MNTINKSYTLRFVKLPPATIILGRPFDIIFSLTDDLGLEVPYFEDIEVAFSIERLSGKNASSQYIARDTATNASTTVINSYTGLLHKRTLKVDARHSTIVGEKEGLYLVLKLVQPGHPVLPDVNLLSQGLMDFVRVEGLLKLSDEEVLAVVVPTYAGPLTLQGSKRGNHSTQRTNTTAVYLAGRRPLRIFERPMDKIIGDHLWHGSIILAYAILGGALEIPVARTVVELGAGCGLASLSAEQVLNTSEATILATDLPEVVESTLNGTLEGQDGWRPAIKRRALIWGSDDGTERLLADTRDRQGLWILAADVLYNPSSHEAFLDTMGDLCAAFEYSTVTIAYRPRTAGDDAFFGMASKRGFPFSVKLILADVQIWQHCGAKPK